MDTSILKDKDKKVLSLIVESYLGLGKPVSSGAISQKKQFPGSPATIRNIMVKLEEEGYLFQPHLSSGRIPTDMGLRLYVNSLLAEKLFSWKETSAFPEDLVIKEGEFNSLFIQASKLLAENADNLAFVISPRISQVHFRHLRFMKISGNKIMIILITTFDMALTQIMESKTLFTQVELDKAAEYINMNFRGKNLLFVRDFLLQELPKYKLKYEDMINKLASLVRTYINQEEGENRIYLQGASKLLKKAELFDMEKLKSLFQNFEEKALLTRLLSDLISLDRVKVLIGSEVDLPDIRDCSLILSHYGYDNQVLGSLGVIGPKRIPYDKIIPLVDNIALRLSRAIASSHHEVSL